MKNSILFLIIIILAGIVSCLGINWGLPNQDHIYTYNIDEMTFLIWLKNMNPAELDFDPKVYSKTHLPIYYAAAVLKIGEVLGLCNIGTKEYYREHPNEFGRVILLQRIFFGKIPTILLIIFSFLIGRILIDDKFGILLAGVSGFLPTILVNNNYAVENVLVTLLIAITFYFSLRYYQSEKLKYIILSGIFTGLSISTKQTGILSFIFILGVLIGKKDQLTAGNIIKYFFIAGVACTAAFSITSPYYMKFLLLKIFSPSSIKPDMHHGATDMVVPFQFNLNYIVWNLFNILKVNFIQLGGFLFLLVPFGIYFKGNKAEFRIIILYIIIFLLISSSSAWATDARLMPMAYLLAILGISGMYCLVINTKNDAVKLIISSLVFISLVFISLVLNAGNIVYLYLKEDNQQISSEWIKKNILDVNDNTTIGLNTSPFFSSPNIITKEWMHNKHPESLYYPNNYNETFIIPEYKLRKYGGDQILPEKELLSNGEKMKWLESKSPEYIVLSDNEWAKYFNKSNKYILIKHFPSYDILGVSKLAIYSINIYIYRKV